MKWEVTLWPNNQPPILVGYYEAKSARDAKIKASTEMTEQGCSLSPNDENLSAQIKSKNTSYQRWINPPLCPEIDALVKGLTKKFSNGKRKNNKSIG